jgi:Na+-transporting NADH:ubiquinone oxidoreductase subunit NqrE
MKIYILVFIFQVMFNIFKTLEIKYTYEHKVKELMINSIWINLVSLGSVYFAIDSLFKGNWSVIIVYIIGSVMGKWVAMTKITDYREKIYSLLLKRKLKEK